MATTVTSAVAAAIDTASTAAADDALVTELGTNAVVEIRTGSAPGAGNAATGTLLASVTISSWTAGSPAAGQITGANPGSVTIDATGTAAHFRIKTSGGTAKMEGTVGTSGADLNVDSVSFVAGGSLDLGAPVFTVPVTAATS